MLEISIALETEQHPSLSVNGDTFPAVVDNKTLKPEDKSESVNTDLDDLESMFGGPLGTSLPALEEVFHQNNEEGEGNLIGQTQEENRDDNEINLMG